MLRSCSLNCCQAWKLDPRSLCSCAATGNQKLEVHILKESFQIWVVNPGDEVVQNDACELFGFNVGNFSDKSVGGC